MLCSRARTRCLRLAVRPAVTRAALQVIVPRSAVAIAVHIRRTDTIRDSCSAAPPSFFEHAMGRFRATLQGPLRFIISSDDVAWCREQRFASASDVFILPDGQHPMIDLAILATCKHAILSGGDRASTFGWWAAWLTGGTTYYYLASGNMSKQRLAFFPPSWLALVPHGPSWRVLSRN